MSGKAAAGLFITGVDTGVGKTWVAARIAETLRRQGVRVGVYKPVASGCRRVAGKLVSDDAERLWRAAGRPHDLAAVCPQLFEAALAPHLAARREGRPIDSRLLLAGLDYWRDRSEFLIVEGAGGLMSPVTDDQYVADLAYDCGLPLVVVAANRLGAINQTLQTLIAAATFREGIVSAGVVLCDVQPCAAGDLSCDSNRQELAARCVPPLLTRLRWQATQFDDPLDWRALGQGGKIVR